VGNIEIPITQEYHCGQDLRADAHTVLYEYLFMPIWIDSVLFTRSFNKFQINSKLSHRRFLRIFSLPVSDGRDVMLAVE